MLTVGPGEIALIEGQLFEPERATQLGSMLLSGIDCMALEGPFRYNVQDLKLTGKAIQELDAFSDCFNGLLLASGLDFGRHEHWLVSGVNGAHIPWHTDTPGDVRFMTNLGEEPAKVDIATEWDPEKYDPGFIEGTEPDEYITLEFETGKTYVSNTLVTTKDILPPHATHPNLSRLVLRTRIYAPRGWKDTATENGIAIKLSA